MNCKDLEKIIPELVEGELDERTAGLAEEHISSCRSCAAERIAYEQALGALAQPRAMLEAPDELNTLELPAPSRLGWTWLRPAVATAAVAAIMAGIMLMPPKQQQPVIPETPRIKHESSVAVEPKPNAVELPPQHVSDAPAVHHRTRAPHGNPSRPVTVAVVRGDMSKGAPVAKSSPSQMNWVFDAYEVVAQPAHLDAPKTEESSVVVVACDIDDQPWTEAQSTPTVVHIESTDPSTGSVSVYDYSRDDRGREQVIEITSSLMGS